MELSGLRLLAVTRKEVGQQRLDQIASALFGILQQREAEFAVHPAVTIVYPDLADRGAGAFLVDPAGYLRSEVALLEGGGEPVSRLLLLTTFGDRLRAPLVAAGYRATAIDMPAGPAHTCWFERQLAPGRGRTLYLEAVDEADASIRPGFALQLLDGAGGLRGGACGSIRQRDGRRYCYLATMAVAADLPPGSGLQLGEVLLSFLRQQGVAVVHLGTQTAAPFYRKLGFRVRMRLIRDLRVRRSGEQRIATDLVMMECLL